MRKKTGHIILIIFLLLVIAGAIFVHKNNIIPTLMYSQKYTSEELNDMLNNGDEQLNNEIRNYFGDNLREYTPEEQQMLDNGEITSEELLSKIIAETYTEPAAESDQAQPSDTEDNQQTKNNTVNDAENVPQSSSPVSSGASKQEQITAKYISKLYSLEGTYMGKLEGLLSSAVSEYKSLPENERTAKKKMSLVSKYMSKGYSLENNCDAQVNSILSSLESELKDAGADTSITGTIKKQYQNTKNVKRAYYLSKIKK